MRGSSLLFLDIYSLMPCTAFIKLRLATLSKRTWKKIAPRPKNYSHFKTAVNQKNVRQLMWLNISYGLPISYFIYRNLLADCKWYIYSSALLFGYEKIWKYCWQNDKEKLTKQDNLVCIFYAAKGCHLKLLRELCSKVDIEERDLVLGDGLIMGGHYNYLKKLDDVSPCYFQEYSLQNISRLCDFFYSGGATKKSKWERYSALFIAEYFRHTFNDLDLEDQITCAEFIVDWYVLYNVVVHHDLDEYWIEQSQDIYGMWLNDCKKKKKVQ